MPELNKGKPYHVPHWNKGVPPMWPEATEGDRIRIHDGRSIKEYEFRGGEWTLRSTTYVRD